MTLLEKIIYIADYIEPTRDFEGVEPLRKLAYEDIDSAMALDLQDEPGGTQAEWHRTSRRHRKRP